LCSYHEIEELCADQKHSFKPKLFDERWHKEAPSHRRQIQQRLQGEPQVSKVLAEYLGHGILRNIAWHINQEEERRKAGGLFEVKVFILIEYFQCA